MTSQERFGQDLLDIVEPMIQDIEEYQTSINDDVAIIRELAEQLRDEIQQFRDS